MTEHQRAVAGAAAATVAVAGAALLLGRLVDAEPDYRLAEATALTSFEGPAPRLVGLPDQPRAGVAYPVTIRVPVAEDGAGLQFTGFLGVSVPLEPLDLSRCPVDTTGPADPSTCTIPGNRFDYASDVQRELPAVVRFPDSWAGRSVRLQYVVDDPDPWWRLSSTDADRTYILGTVRVSSD